ncbi:leucyl aminopeptidase [Brassicibacter mesophilus]|uniref:leucyl aminopeptidase n=1 Tax=Brassicibacter mesophilus TaxID=745119 RepID=UPI003D24E191
MDIKLVKSLDCSYDTRVLGFYENEFRRIEDNAIQDMISHLAKTGEFKGEFGKIESFKLAREEKPNKIILAGLGKKDELNAEKLRKTVAKSIKEGNRMKSNSILLEPMGVSKDINLETSTRILAEIPLLADYKFDNYQKEKKTSTVKEVNILCNIQENLAIMEAACHEGRVLAKETVFARELVNEPANVLLPIELANRAKDAGDKYGFEVEVFDEDKIKELGMEAYISVAKASDNPPRFIVMRYFGDDENKDDILGIAGKGLTYDSGGLCIKSPKGMLNMRADMGGAAAVIGTMASIAQLKIKANVVGVIAACENMISGKGYRTGDIIGSMAGKTIFVGSTDAEGRLTLIDAVHYLIEKEKVNKVLDIATLTGAAGVALGGVATPVLSNNEEFFSKLQEASDITGEKIWRMPCFEEYKELLKSNVADLTNSAGHPGTITAGMFIGEFVQDKPWIHMDIAATSWADKASDYSTEGGTGVGVRILYYLAKNHIN